jgi:hypothetical protein
MKDPHDGYMKDPHDGKCVKTPRGEFFFVLKRRKETPFTETNEHSLYLSRACVEEIGRLLRDQLERMHPDDRWTIERVVEIIEGKA